MSRELINYNFAIRKRFQEICEPLYTYFGLTFGFMRVYNDGRYLKLYHDTELLRDYFYSVKKGNLFCSKKITTTSELDFASWPSNPGNVPIEIHLKYNFWHGFNAAKISPDFTDVWWFSKDISNSRKEVFLPRDYSLISKFINYFNEEANDIITNHNVTELPKFTKGFDSNAFIKNSVTQSSMTTNYLTKINPIIKNLTPREIECLKLRTESYSYKEIGRILSISPRTVEQHFVNLKNKTGCNLRSDFVKRFGGIFF